MNISTPVGIILGFAIIFWAITGEVKNIDVFFNIHSIGIVLGGTFATSLVCFNFSQIKDITRVLIKQISGERKKERIEVVNEIVKLSEKIKSGDNLNNELESVKFPFLKEGLEIFLDGSFSKEEMIEVINKRIETQNGKYQREGNTFKVLGRFPPAFGLIGATLGMIGLLQGLGAPNAFEQLGPSMSIALTATFWGLVLANVIILPLGENLSLAAEEDLAIREIVLEGVILLREKKHPLIVLENLNSFLPLSERSKLNETKN